MKKKSSDIRTRIVLIALALIASLGASAQVRVTRMTDEASFTGRKGLVYVLPRTRVCVDLQVQRSSIIAGPLAAYAKEYLGVNGVPTKNSVEYQIAGASINAHQEPDPGRIYLVEKEEKSSGEIYLSFDPATKVMSLEKYGKDVASPGFSAWNSGLYVSPDEEGLFRKYSEASTREVIDTLIRKISIDTLVIEEKIFKRSMVGFTDVEKAREAVDKIRQIEQDKYNLLVGYQETAYSGDALNFMYTKLEEERQEYLKLFTGVSLSESLTFRFEILPDPSVNDQKYVLTGFSAASGIIPPDENVEVTLMLEANSLPSGFNEDEMLFTGLVYRMPADALAIVSFQGVEILSVRIPVMQLGSLHALPQEFKRVDFDLQTGTVRKLILE